MRFLGHDGFWGLELGYSYAVELKLSASRLASGKLIIPALGS